MRESYILFMNFTIEGMGLCLYRSVRALTGMRRLWCLTAARDGGATRRAVGSASDADDLTVSCKIDKEGGDGRWRGAGVQVVFRSRRAASPFS